MKNPKHTPGPYSVLEAVSGLQITAKAQTEPYQGQAVAIAEVRSWDGEPPINQVRANADLFAAAPELLEACSIVSDRLEAWAETLDRFVRISSDNHPDMGRWKNERANYRTLIEKLRSAVSKAKGE